MAEKVRYIEMRGALYITNSMIAETSGRNVEEVVAGQEAQLGRTSVDKKLNEQNAPSPQAPSSERRTIYMAE